MADFIIEGRYKLVCKIGSGSFGDCYKATDLREGKEVAVKMEAMNSRHPQLDYEHKVYKLLQGGIGIPQVKGYGVSRQWRCLTIELLGPSLEDLFNYCGRRFTIKTVLMLADQMISRIEYIHSKTFIHRDIKPDNFLVGTGNEGGRVYMIDFGLAKKYKDERTRAHIPYREDKSLTGTARYASIYAHKGIEQSRRDDLEALGNVLMYFLRGSLPWQGLHGNTRKQKYQKILETKQATKVETLCTGYPSEFATFFRYIRRLGFDEAPDYTYLRQMFKILRESLGHKYDYQFDWVIKKQHEGVSVNSRASNTSSNLTGQPPELQVRMGRM